MFFSATAFAQNQTTNEQDWEGASMRASSEHHVSTQKGFDTDAQLELSHPWHYVRQDTHQD